MAEDELLVDVETVVGTLIGEGVPGGDQIRFLLDALASATDNALSALSGRIECHTARGGVVEPQLAALRSHARSREEKAAVALVAARAAEGAGDSATACDLLDGRPDEPHRLRNAPALDYPSPIPTRAHPAPTTWSRE